MRWTKLFIPTLREDPAEAKNATHRLLIRAGYMRRQDYLFLGQRALRKIVAIVREEMDTIGAQEFSTTAENAMFAVAKELRSYKQLPQSWYEFHGFQVNCQTIEEAPAAVVADAFRRVFDRCGIGYISTDDEIAALSESGENTIVRANDYTSSLATARGVASPPVAADPQGDRSPEEFHTPGQKTIAGVAAFTGLPATSQMKSLVMAADGRAVLVMLRGDHTLSETKLARVVKARELRPARAEEIREWFFADAGSLGPVNVRNMTILADDALRGRTNMICGANRNDYHLRHVTPGEDFAAEFHDLRQVSEGEPSVLGGAPLQFVKANTLARIDIDCTHEIQVQDRMAAISRYEMPLDRVLHAAMEQHQDADGVAPVPAIAPFTVVITPVFFAEEEQQRAALAWYDSLRSAGIDTLLDDRGERAGVKFKDADLIGIPYRVTIGKKLAQGIIEIRGRRARTSEDVAVAETLTFLKDKLK